MIGSYRLVWSMTHGTFTPSHSATCLGVRSLSDSRENSITFSILSLCSLSSIVGRVRLGERGAALSPLPSTTANLSHYRLSTLKVYVLGSARRTRVRVMPV